MASAVSSYQALKSELNNIYVVSKKENELNNITKEFEYMKDNFINLEKEYSDIKNLYNRVPEK